MLTITVNSSDSNTISIPQDEMEKLGINVGDEIEIYKNENDEIVLRNAAETKRKTAFDQAKKKVFEEWNDVFVALAKGAGETSEETKSPSNRKFVLSKTTSGEYKFHLMAANNMVVFESRTFKSREDAQQAIDAMKTEIFAIKDEILNLPVQTELTGV